MFYLKRVGLKGKLGDSNLELQQGLNVVYGSSNTGKSIIVECIDYALGDKECNIELDGYDTIYLTIGHKDGDVTILRKLGENRVTVQSENNLVKPGIYPVKRKSKSHENDYCLDDLLLILNEIPSRTKIVVSTEWKKQNFTFRTCLNSFLIKQENIIRRESPYLPLERMAQGGYKSGLLFLWTGNTYDRDTDSDDKNWRIRKSAIEGYTEELLKKVERDYPDLEAKAKVDPKEMESNINATLEQINANEDLLHKLFDANKTFGKEIYEIDDELTELNNLLTKYKALNTQYLADEKRLELVIEGEKHTIDLEENLTCPFCNGKLNKCVQESCAEAAQKELQRLAPKIKDLEKTSININLQINDLNAKRSEIVKKRRTVLDKINEEIKPLISKLQSDIEMYKKAIEDANEAKIILALKKQYEDKIIELDSQVKPKKDNKFDVMKYYSSIFNKLENEYNSLLVSGNYQFKEKPIIEKFDFVIDKRHKYSQGQGYRAYLNGLACLALYNSLWQNGVYPMPFLIMDSPIQSLVENDEVKVDESMRTGLFRCLKEVVAPKQVIVIENRLPEGLDYSNVNLIRFTKDEGTGRYGFAKDIR